LSRAYGGRGGTLTKYPRKVESPRATMAVGKLLVQFVQMITKGTNDATNFKNPPFSSPPQNKSPLTADLKLNSPRHDVIPIQILITNGIQ